MGIEGQVWHRCEGKLTLTTFESTNRRRIYLQVLASARALIVNPSTSEETISHILETLVRSLQVKCDQFLLHNIYKLLSDIALHHHHLSQTITDIIRPYTVVGENASQLSAHALSMLFTISESDKSLLCTTLELGEDLVLSLCFSPSVTVRLWFLFNVDKFHIHPSLLVSLLHGLMKDPYPSVRRAALSALARLSEYTDVEGHGLIAECYDRAVELFLDTCECVRSAAVCAVSKLGEVLVAPGSEADGTDFIDIIFVQLCSMARDMSMEVRNEAFVALGKMRLVSEDLLLQSLSKKVLGITKEKKIVGRHSTKEYELPVSGAAGAFVHGLEDEFYKVRSSACNSLGMLTDLSDQFASDALTLLMDMLNDDSTVVRLQALETMHHMAKCDHLWVQETHIQMFNDCLMDTSSLIRYQVRKIFRLMKLPVPEMFASLICGLLTNLETYPQDEDDIWSVLLNTGRSHGNFAVSFFKEVSHEIEPSCEGNFRLDRARVTALLVLAISASLQHEEQHICTIPRRIFSYAIPLIGRISRILGDQLDQETLFTYLSHCSGSFNFAATELSSREDKFILPGVKEVCVATSFDEHRQKLTSSHEEATNAMKVILKTVAESWPLIRSGYTGEVLKTLSVCKEELTTIATDSPESISMLAFTSQYIRVIQLVAKACEHFLPSEKVRFCRMERLNLLLEKLDASLRELRYRFSGLTRNEELHVLELMLFNYALRLCKVEICCHQTTLKRMCGMISRVELLCREGSTEPSDFVKELQQSISQAGTFNHESSSDPFLFKRSIEFFSLKQVEIHGRFKHVKAEVDVPHNDSENPLTFISGLPVGITFQISLYNIACKDRLWLKMAEGEYTQYVFLDLIQFEGCDEVRTTTFTVPLYRTPKVISFVLKVCIVKECLFDDVDFMKGQPGPKHELAFLCREKEIFLLNGG